MNIILLTEDEIPYIEPFVPDEIYNDQSQLYFGAVADDGRILGVLAWQMDGHILDISYIYVEEDCRRKGIAKALISHILNMARLINRHLYVYITYGQYEGDGAMDALVRGIDDFIVIREGCLVTVSSDELKSNERCNAMRTIKGRTQLFTDTNESVRNNFYNYLLSSNLMMFGGEQEEKLLNDISICTIDDKSGDINCCALFTEHDESTIELAFMMMKPGHEKKLAIVIGEALRRFEESYSEKNLMINSVNKESETLIDKVFGNCEKEAVFSGVCIG